MGRGEMGNGKLKRDEEGKWLLPFFENYRFLSLTQNGTNYKFIQKNLEYNIWKKLETTFKGSRGHICVARIQ